VIKLIDFGMSITFIPGTPMVDACGSVLYVCPEVLNRRYDQSCDLWSCGVVAFILLSGKPPFTGRSEAEALKQVRSGTLKFDAKLWGNVSADAQSLIAQLLDRQPGMRLTAAQALQHVWVEQQAPKATGESLLASEENSLRGFCKQNMVKQVALNAIARSLTDDEIKHLKGAFTTMDINQDGTIDMQELKKGLEDQKSEEGAPNLEELMASLDFDGDGYINYSEFIAATMAKKQYQKESACWAAFRIFDKDNSGSICMDELRLVLQDQSVARAVGKQAVEGVMADADKNGDGTIDFGEFMKLMVVEDEGAREFPGLTAA